MSADYSAWLTKQQAADALQCATKTVEQLANAKKLQTAMYRRPTGGPIIRVYHPDDVERLRMERNPDAEPFVLPADMSPSTALVSAKNMLPHGAEAFFAAMMPHLQALKPQPVTLREKVFLTMPEAVQLTGLPDAVIRRMIHTSTPGMTGRGHIEAIMTGQGWRIRRKDLEAL